MAMAAMVGVGGASLSLNLLSPAGIASSQPNRELESLPFKWPCVCCCTRAPSGGFCDAEDSPAKHSPKRRHFPRD